MEFEILPSVVFATSYFNDVGIPRPIYDVVYFWCTHSHDSTIFRRLLNYMCVQNFKLLKFLVGFNYCGLNGMYDRENLISLAKLTDEQVEELGIKHIFKWNGDEIKIISRLNANAIARLAKIASFKINKKIIKEHKLRESDLRAILPHAFIHYYDWKKLKKYMERHNFSADIISQYAKTTK